MAAGIIGRKGDSTEVVVMSFLEKKGLSFVASARSFMSACADVDLGRCHFWQARIRCTGQLRTSGIHLHCNDQYMIRGNIRVLTTESVYTRVLS
jgi:hypothetical protein